MARQSIVVLPLESANNKILIFFGILFVLNMCALFCHFYPFSPMTHRIIEREQYAVLELTPVIGMLIRHQEILFSIQSAIDKGFCNFAVDLSKMQILTTAGLNLLISVMQSAQRVGGNIVLLQTSRKAQQLLEITKLKPLFRQTQSIAEVEALLQKKD
jgi:anti-anti-sigma factor